MSESAGRNNETPSLRAEVPFSTENRFFHVGTDFANGRVEFRAITPIEARVFLGRYGLSLPDCATAKGGMTWA